VAAGVEGATTDGIARAAAVAWAGQAVQKSRCGGGRQGSKGETLKRVRRLANFVAMCFKQWNVVRRVRETRRRDAASE
jgi:hypothetical protein